MEPRKRWVALARPDAGRWLLEAPVPVGAVGAFLARLRQEAGDRPVALGADFPVGLPRAYAATLPDADFPAFLRRVSATLPDFFQVAPTLDEVARGRPFYPARGARGMSRAAHAGALGLSGADALNRICDRATAERPAGAPLFWTLGANQTGKAAIVAWRDMLCPALARGEAVALWPFAGPFRSLLKPGTIAVAETYPAETSRHLGIHLAGSKRRQGDRAAVAAALLAAMGDLGAAPAPELAAAVRDGFGPAADGEDRFDCVIGVLGVLNVLAGNRPDRAPNEAWIGQWEGWVLGQTALPRPVPMVARPATPWSRSGWRTTAEQGELGMIGRRGVIAGGLAATGIGAIARADAPEVKIGNTMPYSGPNSAYAPIGKTESAYFAALNEQGGIAGHRINFISLDDGYSPPKTVELVRRLVEQDTVDFLFNTLGTPTNSAIERYCNQRKVPQLFVATGADKWGDYKQFPWTIGLQPSYRTEAQIYAKYILKNKPGAKIAMLYQNDDFGKDYLAGVRDVLGKDWDKHVIKTVSFEVTDPTIDSQVASLQSSGADTFVCAAGPKAAAQTIRRVHEVGWRPLFFLTNVSISVGAVMKPAGEQAGKGIITSGYLKDATDPAWRDDPGMNEWRAFMAKRMPGAELSDNNYVYGWMASRVMHHVLDGCKGDFSRENVMKRATSINGLEVPVLLPGIKVNTSPTNYHPIRAMQLQTWDGAKWVRFGEVIEGVES